jgi:hypothetical protein
MRDVDGFGVELDLPLSEPRDSDERSGTVGIDLEQKILASLG